MNFKYAAVMLIIVAGVIFYMTGMHAIDNSVNMNYCSRLAGIPLEDSSPIGNFSAANEYMMGISLTFVGMIFFVLLSVMLVLHDNCKAMRGVCCYD